MLSHRNFITGLLHLKRLKISVYQSFYGSVCVLSGFYFIFFVLAGTGLLYYLIIYLFLFIYLFIFGCVGSSLLLMGFV